jgi:hypothetical protein
MMSFCTYFFRFHNKDASQTDMVMFFCSIASDMLGFQAEIIFNSTGPWNMIEEKKE